MNAPKCKCGFPMEAGWSGDKNGRPVTPLWICHHPRGCIHPSRPRELPPAGHVA